MILCLAGNVKGQKDISLQDITVLPKPTENMMKNHLTRIVDRQFAVRDSLLSTLESVEDWEQRSMEIKEAMRSWAGSFPKKTPLNSRITGRLEREEYIVEKLLFESRPGNIVSANVYLPRDISTPRPAILNVIGHTAIGKADERYQNLGISQAKKGFIALVMDGLGQGERQIDDYAPWGGAPGNAHRILGTQAFISGTHVFNFMIWDVIRAIDYLVSRPYVDASRIGITGSSGGGMLSTYILPLEDRISVSVPTCNPNTWSHRVHANLATDHEQIFFGAFEHAIDPRGDPLFAHPPKPLLINATTDDNYNPPRGVWELNTWLFKYYSAHGVPEKLSTSMVDAGHDYNQEQREITMSWMLRWMVGDASGFREEDNTLEEEKDLWASRNGSVYNESGAQMPREWILDYLYKNKSNWEPVITNHALKTHKDVMSELILEVLNMNLEKIDVNGSLITTREVGDVVVKSYTLTPEEGIVLPAVLLTSDKNEPNRDIILYVNQNGKSDILDELDIIKELLKEGYALFAVDLRGSGETSPDMSWTFWDFLAGKPIFGQRVLDVLATLKWLKESDIEAHSINLWGKDIGALYGAFASVLSDDIAGLLLEKPLLSFESVAQVTIPQYRNEIMLPDILEKFDMTQVYQALIPRPIMLLNPLLGDKSVANKTDIKKKYESVNVSYRSLNEESTWYADVAESEERIELILDFFRTL